MLVVNANIANAGRHLEHGAVSNHDEVLTAYMYSYPEVYPVKLQGVLYIFTLDGYLHSANSLVLEIHRDFFV